MMPSTTPSASAWESTLSGAANGSTAMERIAIERSDPDLRASHFATAATNTTAATRTATLMRTARRLSGRLTGDGDDDGESPGDPIRTARRSATSSFADWYRSAGDF